ncbi:MAG: right-handed parallel beta-helix repeat-containing protein, partial [Candidatus Njordarchaeota archaeon]
MYKISSLFCVMVLVLVFISPFLLRNNTIFTIHCRNILDNNNFERVDVINEAHGVIFYHFFEKSALNSLTIRGYRQPVSGDWTITTIVVVENSEYIINGSIIIESGGALILKNSTLFMNLNYDGEYFIDVLSGGNLTLYNSTITAYNIENNYYVRIFDGAVFSAFNSEISYAGYYAGAYYYDKFGLWINTTNTFIKNTTLKRNYYGLILHEGGNATILNSSFIDCEECGLYIYESHNNTIRYNSFTHCDIY